MQIPKQEYTAEFKGAYDSPRRRRQMRARNRASSSEISYLWTDAGWQHLAITLDLFNREVVGWSLKPPLTADPGDRGADHGADQKAPSAGFAAPYRPRQPGLPGPADGLSHEPQGNSYDNALTESWFNSVKSERIYGSRCATHAEVTAATFDYNEVLQNHKPRHSSLGYWLPLQFFEQRINDRHGTKNVA